jgi:hypothetical protein
MIGFKARKMTSIRWNATDHTQTGMSLPVEERKDYSYSVKKKLKGIFGKAKGEVPEANSLCLPVFWNIV